MVCFEIICRFQNTPNFSHLDEIQKNNFNLKISEFFVQTVNGHFLRHTLDKWR